MKDVKPRRPSNLDPLATEMLERLQESPEAARNVVLGGGVALQHFLSFRGTHDIDAWWATKASSTDRSDTLERLRAIAGDVAASKSMTVSERGRSSSDVVSIELQIDRKTIFSFQVASRDIELEPPIVDASPWAPIALETLADNLGSKMSALVARGAPRDFQDVYAVATAAIVTPDELWDLWALKNPELDRDIAKAQVARNIASIELRRPIDTVPESDRPKVAASRAWIRAELVSAPFRASPEPNLAPSEPALHREGLEPDGGLGL